MVIIKKEDIGIRVQEFVARNGLVYVSFPKYNPVTEQVERVQLHGFPVKALYDFIRDISNHDETRRFKPNQGMGDEKKNKKSFVQYLNTNWVQEEMGDLMLRIDEELNRIQEPNNDELQEKIKKETQHLYYFKGGCARLLPKTDISPSQINGYL